MNTSKRNTEKTSIPNNEQTSLPAASANKAVNLAELFAYDSTKPINVKEFSVKTTQTGVKIHEISFDAYDLSKNPEGHTRYYLVEPKGKGPFPAVLYFHWYGPSKSDKSEFLDEASALAEKGVAGLLIDGYFPWKVLPSELEKDKSLIIYQVIELRRAIDYLESLPSIDPKRTGYVGHDYGALYGAVLSGVDKRIGSYVLIAGMGNFSDWFLSYWVFTDTDGAKKYRTEMTLLDPVNYIRKAAPAKVFFQFSDNDVFVSKEVADEFSGASSQPKEIKFYEAQHDMNNGQARLDRRKWLLESLE